MPRMRGRDGKVIPLGQSRCGHYRDISGLLAIELGNSPFNSPSQSTTSTPSSSQQPYISDSSTTSTTLHARMSYSSTPSSGRHLRTPDSSIPHSGVPHVALFQSSTIVGQGIQSDPTHIVLIPTPAVQTPPSPLQTATDVPMEPSPSVEPSLEHDLPTEEVQHDEHGKVIITPIGKGWTPNHHAIEAIGQAIRTQFRGPYHHYEEVPEDVQLKWWTYFKSHIT